MIHKEFPMSVLDRSALSDSPLADLHAIASELSIDGYRRLRRPELIDAILTRQGSDEAGMVDEAPRPGTNGSDSSPNSVADIIITSVAILPSVPVMRPSKVTASVMPSRATCQVMEGWFSPSSSQNSFCI